MIKKLMMVFLIGGSITILMKMISDFILNRLNIGQPTLSYINTGILVVGVLITLVVVFYLKYKR